jgi:hypothetical protein
MSQIFTPNAFTMHQIFGIPLGGRRIRASKLEKDIIANDTTTSI